jgi:hypothetical protein
MTKAKENLLFYIAENYNENLAKSCYRDDELLKFIINELERLNKVINKVDNIISKEVNR